VAVVAVAELAVDVYSLLPVVVVLVVVVVLAVVYVTGVALTLEV
jgi:hypothetical protein